MKLKGRDSNSIVHLLRSKRDMCPVGQRKAKSEKLKEVGASHGLNYISIP